MAFEKITYSGNECKSYVYFSFDGNYFDLDLISRELRIEPTSVTIKSDPVPKKTIWKYEIIAGEDTNLLKYLNSLIDKFEPQIEAINRLKLNLKITTRLQFVIDVDIDPEKSTPYFPFDIRILNFLTKTNTVVDFDLYKTDSLGILDKL